MGLLGLYLPFLCLCKSQEIWGGGFGQIYKRYKNFHKCWSGSLAKRRLCLGPAGVINCIPLSALSFWVSLFPGTRGYHERKGNEQATLAAPANSPRAGSHATPSSRAWTLAESFEAGTVAWGWGWEGAASKLGQAFCFFFFFPYFREFPLPLAFIFPRNSLQLKEKWKSKQKKLSLDKEIFFLWLWVPDKKNPLPTAASCSRSACYCSPWQGHCVSMSPRPTF